MYPNLRAHLDNVQKINESMLRRSALRDAIHSLWGIGGNYANKETFGLHLEVHDVFKLFPLVPLPFQSFWKIRNMFQEDFVLKTSGQSYYYTLIEYFLSRFLFAIMKSLKENEALPMDFTMNFNRDEGGNFNLTSNYKDDLVSKAFMLHISQIFSPITKQKYLLELPMGNLHDNAWSE